MRTNRAKETGTAGKTVPDEKTAAAIAALDRAAGALHEIWAELGKIYEAFPTEYNRGKFYSFRQAESVVDSIRKELLKR